MTVIELLEFAAKAAGVRHIQYINGYDGRFGLQCCDEVGRHTFTWNPLTDDGDALRLAVKLRMDIVQFSDLVRTDAAGYDDCHEAHGTDPCEATRRAIVRAAAEIGKAMP